MKKIEAVFPPQKLDQVRAVLSEHDLREFLVSDLNIFMDDEPSEQRWTDLWNSGVFARLKLEVVVNDEVANKVANEVLEAARTRNSLGTTVGISEIESVVDIGSQFLRHGSRRGHMAHEESGLRSVLIAAVSR